MTLSATWHSSLRMFLLSDSLTDANSISTIYFGVSQVLFRLHLPLAYDVEARL